MATPPRKSGAPKRRPPKPPPDAVLLASYKLKHDIVITIRWFLILVGFGIVLLCGDPMAREIGGRTTDVNVSIGITITITLGGVAAALGAWGRVQKKKAQHLERRNRELEARLRDSSVSDVEDPAS